MTTLIVFGDSICWGAWDPCNGGWVSRLKCKVETELLDLNFPLIPKFTVNSGQFLPFYTADCPKVAIGLCKV